LKNYAISLSHIASGTISHGLEARKKNLKHRSGDDNLIIHLKAKYLNIYLYDKYLSILETFKKDAITMSIGRGNAHNIRFYKGSPLRNLRDLRCQLSNSKDNVRSDRSLCKMSLRRDTIQKSAHQFKLKGKLISHKHSCNKLKAMSMLINPEPYIKRALRLAAEKKNIKSQITISQNLKCTICHKPLLDFNNLRNLSNFGQKATCMNSIYDNDIFNTEITKSSAIKFIGET